MGFPVGYTELVLPNLVLNLIFLLGLLRRLISWAFRVVGLGDLLDPSDAPSSPSWQPDPHLQLHPPLRHHIRGRRSGVKSLSAALIQEILPVALYEAVEATDPPESCAVCLYEFESGEEVRRLSNCRHVFHRRCLDPWVELDQRTCPLCRTPLVPEEMREAFDRRVLTAAAAEQRRIADEVEDGDPYLLSDPFTFLLTSQSDTQSW